jgi:predicted transcriptional regulator
MRYSGKELTKKIFEVIKEEWPVHASGICRKLKIEPNMSNISKIKYHVDRLRREHKINTKKIDRALVSWPMDIEKLRLMHEFIKDVP